MAKKPYNDRDDLEKLSSQWTKVAGIVGRETEWSAAIVRAATASEIAANIAIRKIFEERSQFSAEYVNSLLKWANGIDGKFNRLIIPAEEDKIKLKNLNKIRKQAEKLNNKRNDIVHRGAFSSKKESKELIEIARNLINELVLPWHPDFRLDRKKTESENDDKTTK